MSLKKRTENIVKHIRNGLNEQVNKINTPSPEEERSTINSLNSLGPGGLIPSTGSFSPNKGLPRSSLFGDRYSQAAAVQQVKQSQLEALKRMKAQQQAFHDAMMRRITDAKPWDDASITITGDSTNKENVTTPPKPDPPKKKPVTQPVYEW